MSPRSVTDAFALLDEIDPGRRVPLIATHMACRFGKLEYCLDDATVQKVAARGGVLGTILCEHYITDGLGMTVSTFEHSVDAVCRHIERIWELTGSHDYAAIGSDLDGYIKPALPGLEHLGRMADFQAALSHRYGAQDAEKICSANALRVLRHAWGTPG
jgi:microsomal dipeptidase-like Zn-dependent dipeptidase